MRAMKLPVCLALVVAMGGCVAPEEAPAPRMNTTIAKPAVSTAGFEDAPLPDRKMKPPTGDSIIRLAK